MLGRLLNTLRYRLSRELRDWRKASGTLRENAWPWYQRALIFAGNRPVRYPQLYGNGIALNCTQPQLFSICIFFIECAVKLRLSGRRCKARIAKQS